MFSTTLGFFLIHLNPKVHSPPFAATVAAAPLQLYQEDPVCQPLGSRKMHHLQTCISVFSFMNEYHVKDMIIFLLKHFGSKNSILGE